ncbi:restriction endonuclease subunit S [Corynebacterium sp. MSK039]|uniref:restriction endonuclease subunit S n=1 Tax=Corynebacterium sp. MSK039 TaxID=3050193 RepID=UPI0025513A4A|nr:restriction endonuclease subunit S [Corynebacterium sp. MSK039]MDK8791066.1 restriction endonuclease subunit S [Corynebacterium sp. MSK039]
MKTQMIGDVLQSFNSARLPVKAVERTRGKTPYLGASGVVDYVDGFTHEGSYLCVAEDGANLLTRSLPIAWMQEGKFWANNHLHVLGGVNRNRLKFFQYAIELANIASFVTGSAQPKLNQASLLRVEVPAFGRMQENIIGGFLGSLDDKIAANNHILGIIDETIQSLWKRAVQVGATYTRLDEVIGINPRTPLPKGTLARKVEMKNLPEAGFSISEWAEHAVKGGSRYRNGDTLLARITPCFENGKCGFVDFLEADAVGAGSTEFIVLRPHPDIPPAAPYAVARSADFRAFAAQTMTGTSGRQRVQARDLEAYETLWPNGEQLSNFGSRTTPLLDFAGKLRDEAQTLAKTRDELLPLLMSGKISVREAGQEAAAAGAQIPSEENEV